MFLLKDEYDNVIASSMDERIRSNWIIMSLIYSTISFAHGVLWNAYLNITVPRSLLQKGLHNFQETFFQF